MTLSAEAFAAHVRQRGLRSTQQRYQVYLAVETLGHATPESVLATVSQGSPGFTLSTVYRALEALEHAALVTHTHLGHAPLTYHALTEHRHVHLVCESCGGVTSANAEIAATLVAEVTRLHGFTVDPTHMAVAGRCADCSDVS